jgi:hypothetical protein
MDEESRPLFIPSPMCASEGVFSATTDGAANGGRRAAIVDNSFHGRAVDDSMNAGRLLRNYCDP